MIKDLPLKRTILIILNIFLILSFPLIFILFVINADGIDVGVYGALNSNLYTLMNVGYFVGSITCIVWSEYRKSVLWACMPFLWILFGLLVSIVMDTLTPFLGYSGNYLLSSLILSMADLVLLSGPLWYAYQTFRPKLKKQEVY